MIHVLHLSLSAGPSLFTRTFLLFVHVARQLLQCKMTLDWPFTNPSLIFDGISHFHCVLKSTWIFSVKFRKQAPSKTTINSTHLHKPGQLNRTHIQLFNWPLKVKVVWKTYNIPVTQTSSRSSIHKFFPVLNLYIFLFWKSKYQDTKHDFE